jgi:hypothetical protein
MHFLPPCLKTCVGEKVRLIFFVEFVVLHSLASSSAIY